VHNEVKVVDFRLSEEEHQKRNWEQATQEMTIEETIEFYKKIIVENCQEWNKTNYDNYFEEMVEMILLVEKLKDIEWADNNVDYLKTYKKKYKVKTFYDYTYECYLIERQIEL